MWFSYIKCNLNFNVRLNIDYWTLNIEHFIHGSMNELKWVFIKMIRFCVYTYWIFMGWFGIWYLIFLVRLKGWKWLRAIIMHLHYASRKRKELQTKIARLIDFCIQTPSSQMMIQYVDYIHVACSLDTTHNLQSSTHH